ncbi:MAG: tetratricopeptide repeat protein [Alphaproteobacteria bacterium]|nr:tetratricopeptide repeat protein [Alphaproteobacteria bacterium]
MTAGTGGSAWRQRLGSVLFGTLVLLLVSEAGFRAAGVYLRFHRPVDEAPYTILCEGDSFTYGIGGISFPEQLEELLNERVGRRAFRVVNKGVPGLNTAMLADELEGHLRETRPDVVIVLAGENNSWNSVRITDPQQTGGFWGRVDRLLLASRVYKFVKVASVGWRHATFHEARSVDRLIEQAALHMLESDEDVGLAFLDGEEDPGDDLEPASETFGTQVPSVHAQRFMRRGEYEACVDYMRGVLAVEPDNVLFHTELAACLMRQDRLEETVATLTVATQLPPVEESVEAWFQLGWALQRMGRPDRAVAAWTEGLRLDPDAGRLYQAIARNYVERGQLWRALDLKAQIPALEGNALHRYLEQLHAEFGGGDVERAISESMRSDALRIARTARTHNAALVFSSYPAHAYDEIREAAEAEGAVFVDFRPLFVEAFDGPEDYLSGDNCHCNSEGYRLMAEEFADRVLELLRLEV